MKVDFRKLNREHYFDLEVAADIVFKQLVMIQEKIHIDPSNLGFHGEEEESRRKYSELNNARRSFLQQKVKNDWLKGETAIVLIYMLA